MGERYDLDALPNTRPEIEDLLARIEGEIAEISEQILTEESDDGWAARARAARARAARRFRFRVKAKLERRLSAFLPAAADPRERIAASKLEAQRLNAEAAKRKAEQSAANVEANNIIERRRLRALVTWLRTEHPEMVEAAFAIMNEVEAS